MVDTIVFPTGAADGATYTFDGNGITYTYQSATNRWINLGGSGESASVVVSATRPPPADSNVGDLWWYCGNETNDPGLFTLVAAPVMGTTMPLINHWMQSSPGIVGGAGGDAGGGATVTLETATQINGLDNLFQITTSDYIEEDGTLVIPVDFWVWSDNTDTPAILIDTPGATIINNGNVIGKGGSPDGSSNGLPGGPAMRVTASSVTIVNNTGAFIAGGGGGGARTYGGGGAGGGNGGPSVAGTAIGANNVAGGAGGISDFGSTPATLNGTAGGRALPGVGTTAPVLFGSGAAAVNSPVGDGGSAGDPGNNGGSQGDNNRSGGGGGWGAKGGDAIGRTGGAGGAAIEGTQAFTLDDQGGTVYGSTTI